MFQKSSLYRKYRKKYLNFPNDIDRIEDYYNEIIRKKVNIEELDEPTKSALLYNLDKDKKFSNERALLKFVNGLYNRYRLMIPTKILEDFKKEAFKKLGN